MNKKERWVGGRKSVCVGEREREREREDLEGEKTRTGARSTVREGACKNEKIALRWK